jgi:hypothetical protein
MTNFYAYVETVRKKKRNKIASVYINAVLRTALTRWHTSRDSGAKCGAKHIVEYGISRISRLLKNEIEDIK